MADIEPSFNSNFFHDKSSKTHRKKKKLSSSYLNTLLKFYENFSKSKNISNKIKISSDPDYNFSL
jgi:hypothetical protein